MQGRLIIIQADGLVLTRSIDNPPSLETMQASVEGHIELIPAFNRFRGFDCVAFCNEEGKLQGLPVNQVATDFWYRAAGGPHDDVLVGNVLIVVGDRDFLDKM
ncbi:MAG: DUF3846 domain-containing protein [Pseudohongiellaceae bacterium]